jgi:hypothetical protein
MIADGSGVANMRRARWWWVVLALAGTLATPSGARAVPHPFAWAAFGLTGVGR